MRNSSTLLALESSQSAMANPSLGFAAFQNFPPMNLSVQDANPLPSGAEPICFSPFSTSQVSGRAQTVPSYWFGAPVVNSLTILSSLTDQGLLSSPMHSILVRSSSKCALSPGSFGMAGTTDLSVSGVFSVMGAMSIFTLLLPNQFPQVYVANPDYTTWIPTFLSLTLSYPGARALVYIWKQEGKKRKRKEGGEDFGWREERSYRFPPLAGPSRSSRPVPGAKDPPSKLIPGPAIIAKTGLHGSGSGSVL